VSDRLYDGASYEYSSAAHGLVFCAGACPLDADGAVVAPGDVEAQAHCAVDNLLAVLEARGCDAGAILKTTVYVATADRAELVRAVQIVEERLAPARPPSTLVGVSVLGYPDQLFEIEAIAAVDSRA
jgi:enamine deaminase RidA (YjgF/YER057c/UK114 family)